MVIQFGVKEHIKMAETYRWAEEELVKYLKIQNELIDDSKRYWNGETADAFRQDYEYMLQEGEYAAFMKHVRGMKEVMEESIPHFRRLQQMVVELPTAYGLPCDDEAPEILRLDEDAVAKYHELSDEIIAKNRHFCEEMTRIMDGCEGLVDFSEEKRELEELREEMHRMETFKRMLDEYADEMRRMDNWMVERLSEFVKIGDGTVEKGYQDIVQDMAGMEDSTEKVEEYNCYWIREGLSLSVYGIDECMKIIETLYQAGYVSEEDYQAICHLTTVAEQSPTYVANKLQGYFDHVVTTVYIHNCLQVMGAEISPEECCKANDVFRQFDITDHNSIACLLICCVGETGYLNYVLEEGSTDEERGAGNLQVTGRGDQKDCLQYIYNMNGIMAEIDEEALGYAEEVAEYPWESAAWRWKIYAQTKYGCLDRYVVECAEKSDGHLILGLVLAAECFIHGNVRSTNDCGVYTMNDALCEIAIDDSLRSENVGSCSGWYVDTVGGNKEYVLYILNEMLPEPEETTSSGSTGPDILTFEAPYNWETFEEAYWQLENAGLLDFDINTVELP